jgi:hypothetical protein
MPSSSNNPPVVPSADKSIQSPKHILTKIKEFVKSHKGYTIALAIVVFLSLSATLTFFYYKGTTSNSSLTKVSTTPTPMPTPSPKPIPHGKISFSVSQPDKTKPQFGAGSIDPYDPAQGTVQTVTILAKDEEPITKVTAVLKTDHNISSPVSFELVEGSATDGTWKGSWTVTDSYLYTYNLVLTAESSRGQSSVEATLR